MNKLNILLLCNRPAKNADASTVTDHLDAFCEYSEHNITQLSFIRDMPSRLDLNRFDAVIIHYTIAVGYLCKHYLSERTKQRIRDFNGVKIVFIQDEYRSVNAVLKTLQFIKADILFTCVPESEISKVYSNDALPDVLKVNTLTGYVPKELLTVEVPKIADRPIDVGYRTRKPPYWLGELGLEKWQIADKFEAAVADTGLTLDISYDESRRIYGDKWMGFVSSCKTMLGVESGASVFDFEGNIQRDVDEYVAQNPDASFDEVQKKFLMPYEGKISLNQISPRCFEAAALKTVMVLYEGSYSGILKPWQHYVPLNKDFSNISDVVNFIKDNGNLEAMAQRTYDEIALNPAYSYEGFVGEFDGVINSYFYENQLSPTSNSYTKSGYKFALLTSFSYVFKWTVSSLLQRLMLGTGLRKWMFKIWGNVPLNARNILRPLLRILGR